MYPKAVSGFLYLWWYEHSINSVETCCMLNFYLFLGWYYVSFGFFTICSWFFSFPLMWHLCLILLWNISASENDLCLVVLGKLEFVVFYLPFFCFCLILRKREVCRLVWASPPLEWISFHQQLFKLHIFLASVLPSCVFLRFVHISVLDFFLSLGQNTLEKVFKRN